MPELQEIEVITEEQIDWHNYLLGQEALRINKQVEVLLKQNTVEAQEEVCYLQKRIQLTVDDMWFSFTKH